MQTNINRPLTLPEQSAHRAAVVRVARRSPLEGLAWAMAGLVALSVGAALVLGVALGVAWFNGDTILPGVRVMGMPLGGMSSAEAEAWLATEWRMRGIDVCAGGACRRVAPESLGFTFDAPATAEFAQRAGRDELDVDRVLAALRGVDVPPVIRFDEGTAERGLKTLSVDYAKAPVNAGIRLDNGVLVVTKPVVGQSLDVSGTLTALRANPLSTLDAGRLDLRLVAVPPALNDASVFERAATQLRIAPVNVRTYDPITNKTYTWTVGADVWYGWLSLDPSAAPAWRFNATLASTWLTTQASALDGWQFVDAKSGSAALENAIRQKQTAVNLRVYHSARKHTVKRGETIASIAQKYGMPYPYIQAANPDADGVLMPGDVLVIPSPDTFVPLPVVEHKRIIVSIAAQTMRAYEDGALKWEWAVSTGIASSPTTPGVYQVQSHQRSAFASIWNLDMPYFLGIYKPVPSSDFMNGFHGFPKRNGTQVLWTGSLGKPVTYGCILLSTTNAQLLYDWAEDGVVVEIQA
ncbi:MAG: L,D-transpeptidase family protein [Chloroflexi bacterium]|nr:L,D-transpeptidase family protein [Chloroflexota bacterium]